MSYATLTPPTANPLARNIFLQLFPFRLRRSFVLRWVSCRQHVCGPCFLFHSLLYISWLGHIIHLHLRWLLMSTPSLPVSRTCVHLCLGVFVFNFYCYSVTVVCLLSPTLQPTPAEPTSVPDIQPPPQPHHHPPSLTPPDPVHASFTEAPAIPSSHRPQPTPPWLVWDCSQLQCLWVYFVCFILLMIMFQLKLGSYGICPSPPGLFHLA